ncbi:hypothetical protein JX265_007895 [Neoarthrinium moseri]|uniref:Glycine-rich cell wall structural protein 1 n=1 Tax=Neoarthrinium moseri TaxID=1658444 RepID=A0A9Q0ANU8_9PEZI|nr:uncharacterized protein JN550_006557 [Neoarthrinium moseri]KAI1841343.1 hypothetical protein JX266_012497 [Neoarthrinium moseri]KAI1865572.1 hypothetical protein JX265_007895 [Neoarthrinium moseri]KAI1868069.1 hypothetical protein JN550_006557 [Neoarthrinium moseri]
METVNSIAQAAAKAVWGENTRDGQEPISGEQGDTSKGEPFDKGNIEEPQTKSSTTAESKGAAPEFAKTTGTAAESSKVPDNESTNLKAKDTPADTTKGQNDIRDPENPQTNPKNQPSDVDNTGDGPNEAQKLDGPGPKPLEEVAKEHGGDAGNSDTKIASGASDSKKGEAEPEDPNDPRAPSKGEGTGEKYIKTSGLAADGGDFDASKAGAGREADRLLEQKGIHVTKGDNKGASDTSVNSGEKEKKSLGAKIKEKLHRH